MMRKLAVTVIALSFAAFGCGSDDGDEKKLDGSTDTKIGVDSGNKDTAADQAMNVEAGKDAPVPVDTQVVDTAKPVDTGSVDGVTPPVDTAPVNVDGGSVDSGKPVDGGSLVDGGTVDAAIDTNQPPVDSGVSEAGSVG